MMWKDKELIMSQCFKMGYSKEVGRAQFPMCVRYFPVREWAPNLQSHQPHLPHKWLAQQVMSMSQGGMMLWH